MACTLEIMRHDAEPSRAAVIFGACRRGTRRRSSGGPASVAPVTVAAMVFLAALILALGVGASALAGERPQARSQALADDDGDDEDEAQETPARLEDLPPAARGAIARIAGARAIVEVEKRVEAGVIIYEAEYEVGGIEHCIEVSASGELLALEREVAPASLPTAVRDAVSARLPKGRIREAAAIHPRGAAAPAWYEVEVDVGGRQRELRVRPSGEIETGRSFDAREA